MRAISTEGNAHLEVEFTGANQAHFSLDFNLGHSFGHSSPFLRFLALRCIDLIY